MQLMDFKKNPLDIMKSTISQLANRSLFSPIQGNSHSCFCSDAHSPDSLCGSAA